MGYKVYSKDIQSSRYEQWDDVVHNTRESAKLSIEQAKAWVKSSKYLKHMKTDFKIVKIRDSTVKHRYASSEDPLGMKNIVGRT